MGAGVAAGVSYGGIPIVPAAATMNLRAPAELTLPAEPEQADIQREGHFTIPGGIAALTDSFRPDGDAYDLVLHFHGNTAVVRESLDVAKINAAVGIINLGLRSGPYEDAYEDPTILDQVIWRVEKGLRDRGMDNPKLRRLALSSWSAGYGAVSRILRSRIGMVDAVLVQDGIHCDWNDKGEVDAVRLEPFTRAAELAREGKMLFSITYSEIDPPDYVPTRDTAKFLFEMACDGTPGTVTAGVAPPHLFLESMENAISRERDRPLLPTGEQSVGLFRARGFFGTEKEDHMEHLFQMGATVLPDLARRWGSLAAKAAPSPARDRSL